MTSKALSSLLKNGIENFNLYKPGPESEKPVVRVLDTDMGIDDLMAISITPFMGVNGPDYLLVSSGNTDLKHAIRNAVIIRKQLNLKFIIVRGENVKQVPTEKDSFHGFDGMGNESDRAAKRLGITDADIEDTISLDEFRKRLKKSDQIVYTTIGPLKELASLLKDPSINPKISEIYTMGGGLNVFNCNHNTEFNFAKSPESVSELLSFRKNLTLFPLDVTNCHTLTPETIDCFEKADHSFFPELIDILRFNMESNRRMNNIRAAVLHDMVPLMYQMLPSAFSSEKMLIKSDEYGRIYESPDGYPVSVVLSGVNGKDLLRVVFRLDTGADDFPNGD